MTLAATLLAACAHDAPVDDGNSGSPHHAAEAGPLTPPPSRPSDAAPPAPPEPTGPCATPEPRVLEAPCESRPATTQALPIRGLNGEAPAVTAIHLVDDTLYAAFLVYSCAARACQTTGGTFRSTAGGAWEQLTAEAAARIAVTPDALYWTPRSETSSGAPDVRAVRLDTLEPLPSVSAADPASAVTGLAATGGALYALVTAPDAAHTALSRHPLAADGAPQLAERLQERPGVATGLAASDPWLAWMEPSRLVVADPTGAPEHTASLPASTSYVGPTPL